MKLRTLFILACSILSLAGCASSSEVTTSSNETDISYTEETQNNDEETKVDDEETSEEPEEPQLEPVIALSYGDYEFDISNMTYKDFLAFLQAIGYPASANSTISQMELEPYEFIDTWHGPDVEVTVGDNEETISLSANGNTSTGNTLYLDSTQSL